MSLQDYGTFTLDIGRLTTIQKYSQTCVIQPLLGPLKKWLYWAGGHIGLLQNSH